MNPPKLLLLDFDGVISGNSIALQRDWVMRRLSAEGALGLGVVDDLVRAVATSIPARASLELVSLIYGVEWSAEDLTAMAREVASSITIDGDFEALRAACRTASIPLKIVSLADGLHRILPQLDAASFCPPPGRSKADPATFRKLAASLEVAATETLLVDDTPMALRAAKLAGFQTALMSGSLYDEQDYEEHRQYIDLRCNSLSDIVRLVRENLSHERGG